MCRNQIYLKLSSKHVSFALSTDNISEILKKENRNTSFSAAAQATLKIRTSVLISFCYSLHALKNLKLNARIHI